MCDDRNNLFWGEYADQTRAGAKGGARRHGNGTGHAGRAADQKNMTIGSFVGIALAARKLHIALGDQFGIGTAFDGIDIFLWNTNVHRFNGAGILH